MQKFKPMFYFSVIKKYFALKMDHSPIRETFKFENNLGTGRESFLYKFSEIVKFR